jgi:hypothetical protein
VDVKLTGECRASAGVCDVAEVCDGVADDCPADAYEPASTECRASAGVCDVAEMCTGSGASCPVDAYEPPTTECRGAADVCDAAEMCNGEWDRCPRDMPADGNPCPEGDLCNGDEVCVGWVCWAGRPPACDDADSCTTDSCDAIQGCVNEPILGGARAAGGWTFPALRRPAGCC